MASLLQWKPKPPPVVMITGPKSSGKSTFAKFLTNRLVTDQLNGSKKTWPGVAVLDLDPGQPEHSPPGILSLVHINEPILTASFCHPSLEASRHRLVRSHALGAVTPSQDPEHYIECALDLMAEYLRTLRNKCPLVVNTPGWVQGTGLDLLAELIPRIRPTQVLYMSEDGPEETVRSLGRACQGTLFSVLPSQPNEYTSRTALHLRTMQTMSYFHLDTSTTGREYLEWDPQPLTEKPPWLIKYIGPNRGILGIMFYDYSPPLDLIAEAVNGTVVALVKVEHPAAFRKSSAQQSTDGSPSPEDAGEHMEVDDDNNKTKPADRLAALEKGLISKTPEGIPFIYNTDGRTLDPRHSNAVGLVLIRGIDSERGELQVVTPIPEAALEQVCNSPLSYMLVAGGFDTPTWAFTEELYNRSFGGAAGGSDEASGAVEVTDEDVEDDASADVQEVGLESHEQTGSPWVEMLRGSEGRAVGSRVWRVRRDLGRMGGST